MRILGIADFMQLNRVQIFKKIRYVYVDFCNWL